MILDLLLLSLAGTAGLLAWQIRLLVRDMKGSAMRSAPQTAPPRQPPIRTNPWAPFDVGPGIEPADVARQYRRLARLHHPDRGGDPRTMARINDLYEQLRCQGEPAPIVGRGKSGPR
jgi:hypothetical protein